MTTPLLCARIDCDRSVSYDKPLCYPHWRDFDRFHIFECERCHRFDEIIGELTPDEDLCFDCTRKKDVSVHVHAPVDYQTRYLYILKLDGGQFYVGQTNDLELRLAEHRDGLTKSTANRGRPRLAWFERWVGNR